jgi:uncharacterized protein
MGLSVLQPSRTTVMLKPVGALCNLDCHYCYYLPTKTIYDGREHRMSLVTLEGVFASVLPRFGDDVTIAWQGGEPTLAGLHFFRKAIEYQEKYRRPGQTVRHALQTNGTLLTDDWCVFLREQKFLIGLSVDGPPHFHDHYRLTNRGGPSSDAVLRGLRLLQKHAVEYNILCVLNDFNVHHPDEILSYLLKLGSRWVQFIPAIEWEKDPENPGGNVLAPYSPDPVAYGKFLCRVFDRWFDKYRKVVSVRIFDAVLNKLVLGVMPFCILDGACHNQLTIEHDGAVFGCDHFVERRWQLGHIGDPAWTNDIALDGSAHVGLTVHGTGYEKLATHAGRDIDTEADLGAFASENVQTPALGADATWMDRIDDGRLGAFARRKQHLPDGCKSCEWLTLCYGGCPKHRPHGGDSPEPTILCAAYKMWYAHAMPRLQWLAGYLRHGQQPPPPEGSAIQGAMASAEIQGSTQSQSRQAAGSNRSAAATLAPPRRGAPQRNNPCLCGSGLKYKHCHGRSD